MIYHLHYLNMLSPTIATNLNVIYYTMPQFYKTKKQKQLRIPPPLSCQNKENGANDILTSAFNSIRDTCVGLNLGSL